MGEDTIPPTSSVRPIVTRKSPTWNLISRKTNIPPMIAVRRSRDIKEAVCAQTSNQKWESVFSFFLYCCFCTNFLPRANTWRYADYDLWVIWTRAYNIIVYAVAGGGGQLSPEIQVTDFWLQMCKYDIFDLTYIIGGGAATPTPSPSCPWYLTSSLWELKG